MKQPPTFRTGDPSYLVVASTSGSASPTVLTGSKLSAGVCFVGLRFIGATVFALARRDSTARGESLASHRDQRGAPTTTPARLPRWGPRYRTARRPTGGAPAVRVVHGGVQYREYLREEQRSQRRGPQRGSRVGVERGCIAGRMQPDFHHGLAVKPRGVLLDPD